MEYKKQGKKKYKDAKKNAKVCQGTTILTGPDGRARISMDDGNEINISPDSEVVIETYKDGKKAVLNLIKGKVRSDVVKNRYENSDDSHYRVKTKSAVAGVRGTEFLTSYDAKTNLSRVVTFEGEVAVGNFGSNGRFVQRVVVKPGQYTSNNTQTQPHPPKDVPPAELVQMDQDSQVDAVDKAPASTPDSSAPEADDAGDEQPQADERKPEPSADNNNEGEGRGIASVDPGLETDGAEGDLDGGERDVAGLNPDDGLPPPELDPSGPDVKGSLPPPPPNTNILPPLPPPLPNLVNDGVINTQDKVQVTIVPVLPGSQ